MSRKNLEWALLVSVAAGIAGCGGGGGGGSPPPLPQEVPFTSFQAIQPNQTVVMQGISQTASGMVDSSGTVTSGTLGSVDTANSTVKATYDSTGILSQLAVSTPQSSVTFNRSAGNTLSCSGGACVASTASATAAWVDPTVTGWNYQNFGVWADAPTSTTFISGAISVGNPTPGSAVPTSGPATFNGAASGFYVNTSGALFGTAAIMTANVDFGMQSVSFTTSGTQLIDMGGTQTSNSGLDLSGVLTYTLGSGQFTGTVHTADTTLNGSATGRFYGPNAEEIGGTYGLTGSGVSGMLGAFGGKR